jgi:Endodeoxyribonuclease RusA
MTDTPRPDTSPYLHFTVAGRLCPNNQVIRHYNGRSVKNNRAIKDQKRVRDIASDVAKEQHWNLIGEGGAVELRIICWNPVGDIDGRQKVIMDALGQIKNKQGEVIAPGVVYDDDKRVKRLIVEDAYDWNGPRYEIWTTVMPFPARRPRIRQLRFTDLSQEDLTRLVKGIPTTFNPAPGRVRPMPSEKVPKTWISRARKLVKGNA